VPVRGVGEQWTADWPVKGQLFVAKKCRKIIVVKVDRDEFMS
jgi:hypothetical protein